MPHALGWIPNNYQPKLPK